MTFLTDIGLQQLLTILTSKILTNQEFNRGYKTGQKGPQSRSENANSS